METFCPKCGKSTDGFGQRGLCRQCYLEERDLLDVPEEITVERCEHCGAVKLGMDWVQVDDEKDLVYRVLDHEIEGEDVEAVGFREVDEGFAVRLMVTSEVDGKEMRQELTTRIAFEEGQCDVCAKFHGGYYEYKIQLRGEADLDEALGTVMERAATVTEHDRENFVSNVEELDGGYDLYASSREMAEELLKVLREQYDLTEKRSKELIGEEEGQRVYRSVVSARIE